jgi:hypothetical protein
VPVGEQRPDRRVERLKAEGTPVTRPRQDSGHDQLHRQLCLRPVPRAMGTRRDNHTAAMPDEFFVRALRLRQLQRALSVGQIQVMSSPLPGRRQRLCTTLPRRPGKCSRSCGMAFTFPLEFLFTIPWRTCCRSGGILSSACSPEHPSRPRRSTTCPDRTLTVVP